MKRFILLAYATLMSGLIAEPVAIQLVAGNADGEAGFANGIGAAASFNDPAGLARDALGNIFVCDARNHVIRKISPTGLVSTVAGRPGLEGAANGRATSARFRFPTDIAIGANGDLFVTDSGNHCIRRITTKGIVTTLAGSLGSANDVKRRLNRDYFMVSRTLDGRGAAARFDTPSGIVFAAGVLYVTDTGNHTIRMVKLDGTVTTVAGKAGEWGHADGTGDSVRFHAPLGICLGQDGDLYIADSENHAIRRLSTAGVATTFTGKPEEAGSIDGAAADARFFSPSDITTHPAGGFVISDSFANAVIRVDANGTATLIAGEGNGSTETDRNSLAGPSSIVCDPEGNVIVADTFHQQIRLVPTN